VFMLQGCRPAAASVDGDQPGSHPSVHPRGHRGHPLRGQGDPPNHASAPAATAVTASTNRFAHERSDAPDRRSTWPDPTIQSVVTVTIEPDGAEASIMTIEHELLPPALVRRHAHGWTAISTQLESRLRSTESRSPDPGSRPRTPTAPHWLVTPVFACPDQAGAGL
jgi:hypothetical protein